MRVRSHLDGRGVHGREGQWHAVVQGLESPELVGVLAQELADNGGIGGMRGDEAGQLRLTQQFSGAPEQVLLQRGTARAQLHPQRLADGVEDGVAAVQRRMRVLEHDLDAAKRGAYARRWHMLSQIWADLSDRF